MPKALGYGTNHSFSRLKPIEFDRQDPGADEVEIEILFCGVCHSDVHQAENDWGNTVYPCIPGHEIVGRVSRAGASAAKFKVGDLVGVGCMVDSCRTCAACREGDEQYCEGPNSWLATYNGPMKPAKMAATGTNMYAFDNTFGGYSNAVVVREDFVLRIPDNLPPDRAAPILCAGVTTYSPLRHWKVEKGQSVGVIGFGGLGDMAVKIARAMGATVTVISRSPAKQADAQRLGAAFLLETDGQALSDAERSFDFLLSTVPEAHKVDPFVPLLKRDGVFCAVGALAPMPGYNNLQMVMGRRTLAGSVIGGIRETQEVLDFCVEHGITPDIELIRIQDINDAYKRMKSSEVRFRHVIDMASLKEEMAQATA